MTYAQLASFPISPAENTETDDLDRKYRAPALEKGLDILELLESQLAPMKITHMATILQRSVSELFRMVLVLEHRGYIKQVDDGRDGFVLTNKMFTLGIPRYGANTLLDVALPVLNELVQVTGQSCHMLVLSGDQVVVVARQESAMDLSFSVRVGYRSLIAESHAGALFYGFATYAMQSDLLPVIATKMDSNSVNNFLAKAKQGLEHGYLELTNEYVDSITDLCVPVMGFRTPLAVLVMPFMRIKSQSIAIETALELLQKSAKKISQGLVG